MTGKEFAWLYERDIQKLIEEIKLFENEENLWKTYGTIKNPAGNLALHIIGGLNFLIGTISYVLTQLLLHLNYHTGQVNYIRRTLE